MSPPGMKVTILTGLMNENPRSYDVVVGQVAKALKAKGHTVSILGVREDLATSPVSE